MHIHQWQLFHRSICFIWERESTSSPASNLDFAVPPHLYKTSLLMQELCSVVFFYLEDFLIMHHSKEGQCNCWNPWAKFCQLINPLIIVLQWVYDKTFSYTFLGTCLQWTTSHSLQLVTTVSIQCFNSTGSQQEIHILSTERNHRSGSWGVQSSFFQRSKYSFTCK